MTRWWLIAAAVPLAVWLASADDRLDRHRNLGKAFYENPATQLQAVDEFRKALELSPGSARERLNYSLALLRAGKTAEGIAELENVQKQDPRIPHTWFNLGIQYKKQGDAPRSIVQLETMVKLVPGDPIAHYNLGAAYKLSGRAADATREFEIAARLDPSLAGPRFQLYNAYRLGGRQADAARELEAFQKIKKQQEGAAIPEDMEWNMYAEIYEVLQPVPPMAFSITRSRAATLAEPVDAETAGLDVLDADGDGRADLLVWSKLGMRLYRSGVEPKAGAFPPGPVDSAAPGDFNNDGLTDVAVLSPDGYVLYRNVKGKFVQHETLAAGQFRKAVWLDYDHDYDLDLFLLGVQSKLLRNQGAAGFEDRTADFPFVAGEAFDAVAYRSVADTKGTDLAVSYRGRNGVLYRDKLAGVFEAAPIDHVRSGAYRLRADDGDRDGQIELSAYDGLPHVSADFNGDGRLDTAAAGADGRVAVRFHLTARSFIGVRLYGVKNLKLARGAEVEVKSGALYQKQTYYEVPLVFDLGSDKIADTVRITWPNGLIQNETRQAANRHYSYKEAQRLSGSCPMIWTWNGRQFQFITDVLGVAPLGASAGDGKYFPVDHDEYVQIPRGALKERDGIHEVRITEELSEVAYLDKVALVAVDHPSGIEIHTNDKFKGPPFPEFRLFGVKTRKYPVAARQNGADVRTRVLRRDRVYPENFRRNADATAEMWTLDLDFGPVAPGNRSALVLDGWVDWADGSTFLAKAQEGRGLTPPYLQVRNGRGHWQTVIEDMGMPAGKPKSIVVDLTGKFLTASREVRIVTNLAVYWDEIFLTEDVSAPAARLTELDAAAELQFRGFSRAVIHPERRQPESFLYERPAPASMWNQTPGLYTRYGAVSDLLAAGDDRFVIMGSGDELRLRFDARRFPPLASGWNREFLLLVEGWAKDRDANTAFSQTVEPLPFRAMSAYPYPESERFPDSGAHRAWRDEYNRRPALRPLRPLRPDRSHP